MDNKPEQLPKELWESVKPKLASAEVSKKALEIFRKASEKVLMRFKQTITADASDDMKTMLVGEVNKLGDRLQKMVGNWANESHENLTIYPEGTRFYIKQGETHGLVIEQKPQVRTLTFAHSLEQGGSGVRLCNVALPYVVFIVEFHNHAFHCLRVAYRNSPLRSVDDTLHHSNLPNTSGLAVCMGNDWRGGVAARAVAEQCDDVISHFWQSVFNHDQRGDWDWSCKNDKRLATLSEWVSQTKLDPAFVLNVKWKPSVALSAIVTQIRGGTPIIAAQLQAEVQAIVKVVSEKLTKTLSCIEMGKVSAGELTAEFAVVLQGIMAECYGAAWQHCSTRLTEERRKMEKELDEVVKEELNQLPYFGSKPW